MHPKSSRAQDHEPQTDSWRGSDWMYAAAGGADITNWARAFMVIDPTHVPHVFKFIAATRGPRGGWVDEDFKKQITRHFCHAEDGIYWRAATEDDLMAAQESAAAKGGPANKKAVLTIEKLLTFIPERTTVQQGQLKALIKKAGYPEKPTRGMIKDAVEAHHFLAQIQTFWREA